jgi:hypothetical protein
MGKAFRRRRHSLEQKLRAHLIVARTLRFLRALRPLSGSGAADKSIDKRPRICPLTYVQNTALHVQKAIT